MEVHDLDSQLNRVLRETLSVQEKIIDRFRKIILIIIISYTLVLCSGIAGFFWYESQFETVETTTTTMETEGDNADINSVTNGNQYNDNATHEEQGGE